MGLPGRSRGHHETTQGEVRVLVNEEGRAPIVSMASTFELFTVSNIIPLRFLGRVVTNYSTPARNGCFRRPASR